MLCGVVDRRHSVDVTAECRQHVAFRSRAAQCAAGVIRAADSDIMSPDWTPFSYIVVNLARQIRPNEVAFSGVNSTLPMLACLLAKRAYDFQFTYLNVAGGVEPVPRRIPHSSSDPAIVEGSPAIFANEDFYDLCARGRLDLVFLGCAQVDAEGRTNVSVIGSWHEPKVRLPGGGGAAVMMPTAGRVATWRTEHSPRTLVEKLDFVTAAGNLTTVVTPIAVFQRRNGRLALESWNPQATLDEVVRRTGFQFDGSAAVPTATMTPREESALGSLDPDGAFAAEVRAT
jgi:glutaconate CoA-transferase subunit B